MRQNLTNVTETQLDKVDSFYVVGSTTKEGLIEGKSNVKIDLKKAVSSGGSGEDFSTQLKRVIRKTLRAQENLEVYFIPKYTNLFGPNCLDGATEQEMSVLEPGTVLTMEQVFDSSNYDFLKILFGIKNIVNFIGFDSWGSVALKSIVGEPTYTDYIVFGEESLPKTFLHIGELADYHIGIGFPVMEANKGIVLDYDFETETFTVVEYGSIRFD